MSGSCLGRDFGSMVGLSRVWLSLGLVVSLTAALLMGLPSPAGAVAGYGDVGEGTWYTDAVQWSVDNNIADIAGFCFGPDTPVSRGETAVWIYNMENQPDAGDPHSFSDVTDASQNDAISWMANDEITTGKSPTTFAPDETLTRAEAATFLHRLEGEPAAPAHSFVDVVKGWQQDSVSWMAHTAITTGTSPTTFAPEDTLTRAHLVTFLYRYQDEPDVTLNTTTPDCDPDTSDPDTSDPDTSDPDTSDPDTSDPDTSDPDTSDPDTSDPDTSDPDTSDPDTSDPDTSDPDTSDPDTSDPDTTTTCRASSDASYVVPVAITDLVSRSQFPVWSPDCAEIAYTRYLHVSVMSPSGEHLRDVWDYWNNLSGVSGAGSSPSWSPNGTRIALAAENTGSDDPWTRDIYVVNTDGSEATRLTQVSQWDNDPSWSPDGTEIVFSRSVYQGDSYLVTVAADGTGETVLTAGGVGEHSPSWSPDGQSIGFLTEHGELKVMSPDGSNQRIVVAGNAETTGMSWSADSSQIAYARVHDDDDSCVSIMVVNADGTGTRRITNLAGRSTQPAWSPDGELLLFANSPISGFSRIYVVDPNVDSGLDPDEPCPPIDSYEPDDSLTVGYEQQLGIPAGDAPARGLECRPPRRSGYASTGFPRPIRAPTIGKLRVAVLFLDFPGAVSAFSTEAEISALNYDLVHVPSEGTFTSYPDNLATIEQYLETASYGKLDLELVPLDRWLRTPHSLLSFLVDYDAFFQRSAVSEDINLESVGLAGTEIDWSTIDMVMTVLPSTYFQGGNAAGAVRINDRIVPTLRLNVIPRGEALSAPSPWGRVGAHELLHILGLTDLYPTQQPGYQGEFVVPTPPEGMGHVHVRAGLMGLEGYYFAPLDHLNGWNSFGQSPKEMLAWHRWQLGWLEPHQISCVTEPPTTITLRSVTDPGSGIAMAAIPISDTKQIVIESRRSTGYDRLQLLRIDEGGASIGQDRSRTYGGVLVYTVDSSLSELPIKFATDDGDGVLERSPLLAAGSSVVIDGYEIRVIADAGDTHTVQITKLS